MDRLETAEILTVLKAAYPQFYNGLSVEDANGIVDLWAEMFKDEPAAVVALAVKAMIASRTNTFPPNIGEVKAQTLKMQMPQEMTAAEAWALVYRAISNSSYCAREEYDRLPPAIQRLVGSPNQLREWGMMNSETVQSVVASNFQRSYTARVKSDREYMTLPSDIKQMLSGVTQQFALGEGTGGMNGCNALASGTARSGA